MYQPRIFLEARGIHGQNGRRILQLPCPSLDFIGFPWILLPREFHTALNFSKGHCREENLLDIAVALSVEVEPGWLLAETVSGSLGGNVERVKATAGRPHSTKSMKDEAGLLSAFRFVYTPRA